MKKNLLMLLMIIQIPALSLLPAFCAEDISEEDFEKASAAYKRGISMYKSKEYDAALDYFNEALKYNPEMTDAYFNIASVHTARQNYDEAYNMYLKIMKLNPYDYDAVLQAAKIAYNRQNYALVMKYLKHIPSDYENYGTVQQLYSDAEEMFEGRKKKIERAKITSADETQKVLIDKLNSPAGIAVDSEGNMFAASYSDNSIIKIDKNGKKTVFMSGYLLEGPVGLAVDEYDNLYAANYDADNILKITKSGEAGIFIDKVSKPYFLYIKNDILYISEQGNDVILTCALSSSSGRLRSNAANNKASAGF